MSISDRKKDHIQICLDSSVEKNPSSFDRYDFEHVALPEINFDEIDVSTSFLGYDLSAPLLISSMTGGTKEAKKINSNLARGAEAKKIALALGSERALLEDSTTKSSFNVRKYIPNMPLIGNIGAANLNYGVHIAEIERAISSIDADGLFLHLNPLQEVAQEGGDTNFKGLIEKIGEIVAHCSKPILIKEVGNGISGEVVRKLMNVGVRYIDISGRGGTTWVYVESQRTEKPQMRRLGNIFSTWGIDTMECLEQSKDCEELFIIAGGGVRSGLDVAKAIATGASLVTLARPFLSAAMISPDAVSDVVDQLVFELKVAMFCVGARNLDELSLVPLKKN